MYQSLPSLFRRLRRGIGFSMASVALAGMFLALMAGNVPGAFAQEGVTSDDGGITLLGGNGNSNPAPTSSDPSAESPDPSDGAETPATDPVEPSDQSTPIESPTEMDPPALGEGGGEEGAEPQVLLPRSQADAALASGGYVTTVVRDASGAIVQITYREVRGIIAVASGEGNEEHLSLRLGEEVTLDVGAFHDPKDPDSRATRVEELKEKIGKTREDLAQAESACQYHSQEYHGTTDSEVRNRAAFGYQFWNERKTQAAGRLRDYQIQLLLVQQ